MASPGGFRHLLQTLETGTTKLKFTREYGIHNYGNGKPLPYKALALDGLSCVLQWQYVDPFAPAHTLTLGEAKQHNAYPANNYNERQLDGCFGLRSTLCEPHTQFYVHSLYKACLHYQTMNHVYTWGGHRMDTTIIQIITQIYQLTQCKSQQDHHMCQRVYALVTGTKRLQRKPFECTMLQAKETCLRTCRHEEVSSYASYICLAMLHRALQQLTATQVTFFYQQLAHAL